MSPTITLQFIGTRKQDFTLPSPTDSEVSYYVQPGQPIEVSAADAKALIERDPHLWAQVETVTEQEEDVTVGSATAFGVRRKNK